MASSKPHCNFRVKEFCPRNGDRLQSSVVHGCKTTSNKTAKDQPNYIAVTKLQTQDLL